MKLLSISCIKSWNVTCLAAVGRGGEKEKKVRVKERYHSTALLSVSCGCYWSILTYLKGKIGTRRLKQAQPRAYMCSHRHTHTHTGRHTHTLTQMLRGNINKNTDLLKPFLIITWEESNAACSVHAKHSVRNKQNNTLTKQAGRGLPNPLAS